MIKNRISLFLATFLIISFFFLALPEKGFSGVNPLGCCLGVIGCIGCGSLENCAIRESDCPEGADFTSSDIGEACLTNGVDACKTLSDVELFGCCVNSAGNCNGEVEINDCSGEVWFFEANCSEVPECAPIISPIPTLSEWGLISVAVILGIVGFMVIRRRKASA